MDIELRVGKLKLQLGSNGDCWHIVHPMDPEEPHVVLTVAFIETTREPDCNLRTVGMRPWEMNGTTIEEFFRFAEIAMRLINQMLIEEEKRNR